MKRLKKGPEIDLSKLRSGDLKPPKAISDLYRELKNQRLLPIVALLVVALIAVPVLVGGSDHKKSADIRTQPTIASSSKPQTLEVSKWTPGLLDYKKSLRGTHPTNPFASKVKGGENSEVSSSATVEPAPEPSEIEVVGSEETSTVESSPPAGETTPSSPEERTGGESKGQGEEAGHDESGAITVDVQVTTVHEDGGVDRNPLRRELPQLTKLPSEAVPAFTYVGPSEDGTKAMMAVSSEVTAMIGDSKCIVHAKPCGLLALQVGAPETIVYGPRGLTYRIELVRIGDHALTANQGKPTSPGEVGSGTGKSPAPREADALIGVGGGHVVENRFGL